MSKENKRLCVERGDICVSFTSLLFSKGFNVMLILEAREYEKKRGNSK